MDRLSKVKVILVTGPLAGDWKETEIVNSVQELEKILQTKLQSGEVTSGIMRLPSLRYNEANVFYSSDVPETTPITVEWRHEGHVHGWLGGKIAIAGPIDEDDPEGQVQSVTPEALAIVRKQLYPLA